MATQVFDLLFINLVCDFEYQAYWYLFTGSYLFMIWLL